ncbi:MAG: hypothetical protein ACYC1C_01700 [Chloroflexota bacterium]
MDSAYIQSVTFGSFLKLSGAVFLSIGIVSGVVGLIASLLGVPTYITLGPGPLVALRLEGVPAGLAGLLLMPISHGLVGLLLGIFAYLPFRWFLGLVGGLSLHGDIS